MVTDDKNDIAESVAAANFTVNSAGVIKGSHHRKPNKYIVVNNEAGETYTGKVYAEHNGHNGTMQLVGLDAMTVGTPYMIRSTAADRNYKLTTTRPPERGAAAERAPAAGTTRETQNELDTTSSNGDLYVGSGG